MRKPIKFVPEYSTDLRRWAYTVAKSQLWRVFPDYQIDDLMCEAGLAFAKCKNKYPDVTEEKHFAALFRTTFIKQILNIAKRRGKKIAHPASAFKLDGIVEDFENETTAGGIDVSDLTLAVEEAPQFILQMLDGLNNCDNEQMRGESHRDFVCRLAGKDPEIVDIFAEVCYWLGISPRRLTAVV